MQTAKHATINTTWVAAMLILVGSSPVFSGEEGKARRPKVASATPTTSGSGKTERPPSFVLVSSKHGEERLQAECEPKGRKTVSCKFVDVTIVGPDSKKIAGEEEKTKAELAALEKDPDKLTAQERECERTKLAQKEKGEHSPQEQMEQRIREIEAGPKESDFMRELARPADACSIADQQHMTAVLFDHERRTCTLLVNTFSLEFTRIGPRRWLSDPGPQGACNLVRVYELTGGEQKSEALWTLSEKTITVGETKSFLCKGMDKEAGQQETWSWQNPDEFELPCEFVDYTKSVFLIN